MPSAESKNQSALVRAASGGDARAFEELFHMHHVGIFNFVLHMVGQVEPAQDLTQATFINAWRALPRLKKSEAFVPWLFRIARNLARDYIAQRKEHELAAGNIANLAALRSDPRDDPAQQTLTEEQSAAVHEAIAKLPAHHREVVLLHHIEGLPVDEVAEALGVPRGTVLSRLARAREALRRSLAPLVEEE